MRVRFFRQRLFGLIMLFYLLLSALSLRLFVLMNFPRTPQHHGTAAAREQEEMEHFHLQMIDDARGRLRFANGQPWSGKIHIEPDGQHIHLESVLAKYGQVVVGTVGLPDEWPSSTKSVPEQGRSGLEYTFDAALSGHQPAYTGHLLRGSLTEEIGAGTYANQAHRGADLLTTVDAAWQQKTDEILHASRVRQGAVVIIDVKNNRLLAMSSSSPDGTNRAVIPDRPGSVMKVVTAAAAVEAHTAGISSVYYCTGQLMTPSVRMRCWRIHGQEALVGALASSCDIAFAEIGIETGRFALEKMARQCGIYGTGLQTFEGHSILPEAMPGRLFQGQGVDKGLIANTAIGQQDAVISPLQGALLANAVANQGSYAEATLASAFLTSSHRAIAIPTDRGHRAFSRYAASVIAQAMWNAAHQSTGTAYGLRRFNVAVKTGTAELPNRHVNAWTIGFFPAKSPKYAFATVSENESSLLAHRQTFHMDELLLQFASSTKLDQ